MRAASPVSGDVYLAACTVFVCAPLVTAATPADDSRPPIDAYFTAHDFLHHDETEALTSTGRSVIASGTQYHLNVQQGILEDIANVHGLIEEHYDDSTLMDVTMIWLSLIHI